VPYAHRENTRVLFHRETYQMRSAGRQKQNLSQLSNHAGTLIDKPKKNDAGYTTLGLTITKSEKK
jgi:hypothetical protein